MRRSQTIFMRGRRRAGGACSQKCPRPGPLSPSGRYSGRDQKGRAGSNPVCVFGICTCKNGFGWGPRPEDRHALLRMPDVTALRDMAVGLSIIKATMCHAVRFAASRLSICVSWQFCILIDEGAGPCMASLCNSSSVVLWHCYPRIE